MEKLLQKESRTILMMKTINKGIASMRTVVKRARSHSTSKTVLDARYKADLYKHIGRRCRLSLTKD